MSLRCSLLGHSYGEAEIERDREEQGSEVVVTVREFEECERCGNQNVISENKEVTALESPAPDLESAESGADLDADHAAAPGASEDAISATSAGTSADAGTPGDAGSEVAGGDDAEILTDSPDDSAGPGTAGGRSGSPAAGGPDAAGVGGATDAAESVAADASPGDDFEDSEVAADDDGVILDDDGNVPGEDGRSPGEWPDAETTHPAEADDGGHDPWPDVGQEDEGFDAEPGGESADVEFGGGLAPESGPTVDENETDEVEFINAEGDALRARDAGGRDPGPELSSGISAGAEAPSLSGPADDPAVDAEFVCPECDYREAVAGSSLRAGDICPECARGYLAQE